MPSFLRFVIRSIRAHWLVSVLTATVTIAAIGAGLTWNMAQRDKCHEDYQLLNPLWRCRENSPAKVEYEAFKDVLALRLKEIETKNKMEVALYFRDLQSGPWFGINEDKEFFPASLTKLPTMLALLKVAELNPDILGAQIGLQNPPPVDPSVDPSDESKTIIIGKTYTVEEVLRRSVIYSDNSSDFLLRMYLSQVLQKEDFLLQLFKELGIAGSGDKVLTLTVKEYSSLFRILYNRQFLTPEYSQKALSLLASSSYRAGLVALLPPGTKVAHKFGYYEGGKAQKELLQLHDCGIVYHPVSPYTLCVMTRGKDLSVMTSVIAELSKAVYDEVTAHEE